MVCGSGRDFLSFRLRRQYLMEERESRPAPALIFAGLRSALIQEEGISYLLWTLWLRQKIIG